MNINQKIKTMILLFLIISLNTYIGCKRDEKEGFIKGVVNGVLEIIPIEPIKDFLQEDVEKGEGGFEVLLVLAFSIFKLIILIGVMPFVMLFVAKASVIWGMMTVTSGMLGFFSWFTGSTASGISNAASIASSTKNLTSGFNSKEQTNGNVSNELKNSMQLINNNAYNNAIPNL